MAVMLTISDTYSLQESAEHHRFVTSCYLWSPSFGEVLVPILQMSRWLTSGSSRGLGSKTPTILLCAWFCTKEENREDSNPHLWLSSSQCRCHCHSRRKNLGWNQLDIWLSLGSEVVSQVWWHRLISIWDRTGFLKLPLCVLLPGARETIM